ncbi:hypothetical protein B0H15DRAFT_940636 [Mycena belliarum]|uniref:Uncharacterized protein n=1 Tax=Mycena belliarum TaxID=1033014 RepID=A0AAD6TUI7_9AGAR|nr:hypothetical protein B0H15DRAFT_940636 [Mycena belliae]
MFNPYAQGGWKNTDNPNALGSSGNFPPQPSIMGALPYPTLPGPPPTLLAFNFAAFNPSILNCTVTGPRERVYFRIATDAPMVGFTVFFNAENQPVAIIEWLESPVLEIRGILSKRPIRQWLELSENQSHRKMEARGKMFVWAPGGDYIFLYAPGVGEPELYAQVSRGENAVTLQLTGEAIRLGLLEVCVAATLLLQCGRNID